MGLDFEMNHRVDILHNLMEFFLQDVNSKKLNEVIRYPLFTDKKG
jgi:hypothetical protein